MTPVVSSLALNGVSDYAQPQVLPLPKVDTTTQGDGYGFNLGTLFKGWELYNDTRATSVPTAKAAAAAEAPGPNYVLIGVAALAAILLLRR